MAEITTEQLPDDAQTCESLRAMLVALEKERDSKVMCVAFAHDKRIIITASTELAEREMAQTIAGLTKVFWTTAWATEDQRAAVKLQQAYELMDCVLDELPPKTCSELIDGIKEWMEAERD